MGRNSGGVVSVTTNNGTYQAQNLNMAEIIKHQQNIKALHAQLDEIREDVYGQGYEKDVRYVWSEPAEAMFAIAEKYGNDAAKSIAQRALYQIYAEKRASLSDKQKWVIAYSVRNADPAKIAKLDPYRTRAQQKKWLETYSNE